MKKALTTLLLIVVLMTICSCGSKDVLYIKIDSDSMAPKIRYGDVIIVKDVQGKETANKCKVGDIITFYSPQDINGDGKVGNDIETHQITKVREDNGFVYYTTIGINEKYSHGIEDPEILSTQVIGIYTGLKQFINPNLYSIN